MDQETARGSQAGETGASVSAGVEGWAEEGELADRTWGAEVRRLLFGHDSLGIFKTTPDGRILLCNPALARMMGYDSPAQMIAEVRDLAVDVHVDSARRGELVRRLSEAGRVDEEITEVRRRDGGRLWVKQSARQINDTEGNALYYLGTLADVTPEIERLDAQRAAERSYREIFENVREGIYRSTIEGRQLRANPALVRLNGYDSEEELLAAVNDIATEWYVEAGRRDEFVRLMARDGKVDNFVSEIYRHKTRERIWVEENARLVRDEAGRALYFEGTVQEITDRKEAEAELWRARLAAEAANRAKSAFLANMSHELRTPLNAIIGFAEVMLREFYGPIGKSRYLEYLEDIRGSGLLLLQLLDDILDLSKVEAGKIELAEEAVDLQKVCADCLRMLSSRAKAGGVALSPLVVPERLPLLRGDERRLRQVVLNLVSNAVKYNRADGTVRVVLRVEEAEGSLLLKVVDSGPGIPEEELERVFEPFAQLDGRPALGSGGREGVGLGLPLARQLVALHDGELRLISRADEGTQAEVRFPAARCLWEAAID